MHNYKIMTVTIVGTLLVLSAVTSPLWWHRFYVYVFIVLAVLVVAALHRCFFGFMFDGNDLVEEDRESNEVDRLKRHQEQSTFRHQEPTGRVVSLANYRLPPLPRLTGWMQDE